MRIGEINKLTAARTTDNGFYLEDEEKNEVLLPNAYVSEDLSVSDEIEVFLYKDSEDRLVATTQTPYIKLEEFAFLTVKDVNKFGAFMDWGLLKDLMVPFAEQSETMEIGKSYIVFLMKDERTDRLVGTNIVEDVVFYDDINIKEGDEVEAFLYKQTDLGMNAVVNGLFKGLIFKSDIHKALTIGDKVKAYVKNVRADGKIDLILEPLGYKGSIDINTGKLLNELDKNNGFLALTDKSAPEEISNQLGLSKKAFKRAVSNLYKNRIIKLEKDGIRKI